MQSICLIKNKYFHTCWFCEVKKKNKNSMADMGWFLKIVNKTGVY